MLKIGITGGIGSGKTTVCKIFHLLGVPIYYADDEAKKLLDQNENVRSGILKKFGNEVLNSNGLIDRKELASIVFNNKEKLDQLNGIIHPAVAEHFEEWLQKNKNAKYILKEAAILFESNAYKAVDRVITVVAPLELKIERAIQRDKTDRKTVEDRIKNQISDEEKMKRSQFVIINDEKQLLIPQVIEIHQQLLNI